MPIGTLAVVFALTAMARSDDPPGPATSGESSVRAPSATATNDAIAPLPPGAAAAPSAVDFAAAARREESASTVASSYTPNMIGDMGGGPTLQMVFLEGLGGPKVTSLRVPSPSANILGCQRFADNDCTLPTDRLFSDYSFFHNADLGTPSDASRFVPGFEKTFLDGRMSVEMRFPLGDLASSDFTAAGSSLGTTDQFGDIQVIVKGLLYRDEAWALGMGMDVSVPTAADVNVANAAGGPLVKIANQSTHLLPYVALLVKPNEDWFAQFYVQVDVAADGNPVSLNQTGNGLAPVGTIYDQTLIFVDASIGRWLYRNSAARFSGLAAVVEAHYTGGLNAPSSISTSSFTLAPNTAEFNDLDLTVGAHAVFGNTTVTVGYATPVTNDRYFDGELRCFANWNF